jgi:DNA-binding CsgD family transcriptional regulator
VTELVNAADALGAVDAGLISDVVGASLHAGLTADEVRPLESLRIKVDRGQPGGEGAWQRLISGQIAEADGRAEEALAAYSEALASKAADIRPSSLGLAATGAARVALSLGDLAAARGYVEQADRYLLHWPGWRRSQLEALKRRLGVGDVLTGPDSLTPREREVAALLAEGVSNAELAQRLFISRKTAAVHVSNILAKLGMGSRTEVAAWAIREGIAVPE